MQKIYILDTNVLVHDPTAINRFEDNHVVIPIVVIEELDSLKKGLGEVARNAREAINLLDSLRLKGALSEGVNLDTGGTIRIELNHQSETLLPDELNLKSNDNRILCVAKYLADNKTQDGKVILVSKDANIRVKSDALKIEVQDYRNDKVDFHSLYTGFSDDGDIPNSFIVKDGVVVRNGKNIYGLLDNARNKLLNKDFVLTSKNTEQLCALDLLLDSKIPLVALVGKAGTGKSLLSVAAGAQMVRNKMYKGMVVSRPTIPVGKDMGYLPGGIEDKMEPWMRAIKDSLNFLGIDMGDGKGKVPIIIEPLAYIRGRTFTRHYIIIDETQNLTPHEIKSIVTRVGEGSKMVLAGDPWQIDNPYLDSASNGLSYLVDRFKGDEDFGTVMLTKGVRSKLAEKAANLL